MRKLSALIFKLAGWKIVGTIPENLEKAIMIIAPHTSNWDFIIGRLAFNILNIKVFFLIKKEFFFFPLGVLLKTWGAIPVDRTDGKHIFFQSKNIFAKYKTVILTITPEGTRKPVIHWKRGFYQLAQQNQIPLIMGALDYKRKEAIIAEPFMVSGNYIEDLERIKCFYQNKTAKHPSKFNPEIR